MSSWQTFFFPSVFLQDCIDKTKSIVIASVARRAASLCCTAALYASVEDADEKNGTLTLKKALQEFCRECSDTFNRAVLGLKSSFADDKLCTLGGRVTLKDVSNSPLYFVETRSVVFTVMAVSDTSTPNTPLKFVRGPLWFYTHMFTDDAMPSSNIVAVKTVPCRTNVGELRMQVDKKIRAAPSADVHPHYHSTP